MIADPGPARARRSPAGCLLPQRLADPGERRDLGARTEGEEEVGVFEPHQARMRVNGAGERLHGGAMAGLGQRRPAQGLAHLGIWSTNRRCRPEATHRKARRGAQRLIMVQSSETLCVVRRSRPCGCAAHRRDENNSWEGVALPPGGGIGKPGFPIPLRGGGVGKPGFPTPLLQQPMFTSAIHVTAPHTDGMKIILGRATPSQTLPPGGGMGKPGFPILLRGGGVGKPGFPTPLARGLFSR